MKKILTILLAGAMIVCFPAANIFAENNDQTIDQDNTTDVSVTLTASKASTYTVKLPVSVDVSNASSTFKVFILGDVDGSKQVAVSATTGTYQLTDEAGLKDAVDLTIENTDAIAGSDIKADYDNDKYIEFTITHEDLDAASYTCTLPITIALQDISAA